MKQLKITVNGKAYDVQVEEVGAATALATSAPAPAAEKAAPAAPAAAPAAGSENINSPMPGTILDVKVANGAAVKAGEVLLVLEAMKMENEIKAPHDATVAAVLVKKGDTVDSGTPLVSLS